MARHLWTILCTKASIDSRSNNISLFEIIDQLNVVGSPADERVEIPAQFDLVTQWIRSEPEEPERVPGRVSLRLPDGDQVGGSEFEIDLSEKLRHRNVISIGSLPLHGPGHYEFLIDYRPASGGDWQAAYQLPLQIVFPQVEEDT